MFGKLEKHGHEITGLKDSEENVKKMEKKSIALKSSWYNETSYVIEESYSVKIHKMKKKWGYKWDDTTTIFNEMGLNIVKKIDQLYEGFTQGKKSGKEDKGTNWYGCEKRTMYEASQSKGIIQSLSKN